MLEKVIAYFAKRHLMMNFIFLAVFIGGVFAWQNTSKEEMPDITFNRVRISVTYPGAPAEDVEYFVTKPIEEEVRGLDGVYRVTSTSSVSQSNITIELEQNYPAFNEAIAEIRNAVLDVDLPEEVIDDPRVRIFKTSKKAILDVALIHKGYPLLDIKGRRELQKYALALENQLLNISEVNSVNRRGYLQEEIQIKIYPEKLRAYAIPFNTVMQEIRNNHVRKPVGTIETKKEPKVTLISELNTIEKLDELIIQGGFEGKVIRLGEVAEIREAYEKNKSIIKINGYEGVMFNVVKNSSYGILEGIEAVNRVVRDFRKNNLEGTPIELILLDDESIDIRNRLSIIAINGGIGFLLILITLFIFLNKRSGLWVAMGIPFTFCFTMIFASIMGYTINGTTLAAVIIVMGIIVDDAIVVAENITRLSHQGMDHGQAVVKGTQEVLLPIIASVVTTCIAFIPLFFFKGHFGKFVSFIPPIVFLMLGASLLESLFILPGHMDIHIPFVSRFHNKKKNFTENGYGHWFDRWEERYGRFLEKILPYKKFIFLGFIVLLIAAGFLATKKMKFVLFPHEETRDLVLTGSVAPGATRFETAEATRKIEDMIVKRYHGKEMVAMRSEIARSRRGGAVEENKFRMIIEIVPKEKREKSADQLIEEMDEQIQKLEGFQKVMFRKSRWGQESGSPIELIVQQNDDALRDIIVRDLARIMEEFPALDNIEIDEGLQIPEYRIDINRERVKRLSINPADIASTLRAALEGTILYEFTKGDEDVRVRFTTVDEAKDDIEKVLSLPVENKGDYLVPLKDVVFVEKVVVPNAISRRDLKRTTLIDADMAETTKRTPVEVAEHFEKNVFPKILAKYPTSTLSFGGEVQDTRESRSDLINAIIMVVFLIYSVLAVLFNSLTKPLIIMLAIPFGVVGIVIAFWLHGKTLFGFYAAIGALGLAGVVINDSIIMLVKLDKTYDPNRPKGESNRQIARIAATRLRAVILTTITTVVGVLPTAYGFAGYDATLAEMMLALAWGLVFGTVITLVLIPSVYSLSKDISFKMSLVRFRAG